MKIIFGLDENGNDIFVINKNNVFKIIKEEPTSNEWTDIFINLNISYDEELKIRKKFNEWNDWYKQIKKGENK